MVNSYEAIVLLSFSQPQVTIADGVDSSPIEYVFSYGAGSLISVSTNSTPQCNSSSCQHTYNKIMEVQQFKVFVNARNIVGLGNASTPVTVGR